MRKLTHEYNTWLTADGTSHTSHDIKFHESSVVVDEISSINPSDGRDVRLTYYFHPSEAHPHTISQQPLPAEQAFNFLHSYT